MGLFDLFKKKVELPSDLSPEDRPTEKQLSYAKDLGIKVTKEMSKTDVSCLISRANGDDSKEAPAPGIIALANGLGVTFSPYIGADGLLRILYRSVDDKTRAALYAYAVYQKEAKLPFSNMLESPELDRFRQFGEQICSNASLCKSLNDRDPKDLLSPRKGTNIYNAAFTYLFEK